MGKVVDSKAADVAAAKLAEGQHGLITRAQALALGMSSAGIQRRVRSGRWEPCRRGVYSFAGTPKTRRRDILEACLGAGARAVASGFSAAEVLGLPGLWPRNRISVSVPAGVRRKTRAATLSRSRFVRAAGDRGTCDGIPTTSVARTYVDLAVHLPVHVLERSITQAVRNRLVTPEELEEAVQRGGPPEAVESLQHILAAATWQSVFRSDSEIEGVQQLRLQGFDRIRTNAEIHYAGIRIGEADILIDDDDVHMVVEIDGPIDHSSLKARGVDVLRKLAYRAIGFRVVRVHPNRLKDPGDFANVIAHELSKPAPVPVDEEEFRRLWAQWVKRYGDPNEGST